MAKRKRTNNNLQNTTQKTKDQATWTPPSQYPLFKWNVPWWGKQEVGGLTIDTNIWIIWKMEWSTGDMKMLNIEIFVHANVQKMTVNNKEMVHFKAVPWINSEWSFITRVNLTAFTVFLAQDSFHCIFSPRQLLLYS